MDFIDIFVLYTVYTCQILQTGYILIYSLVTSQKDEKRFKLNLTNRPFFKSSIKKFIEETISKERIKYFYFIEINKLLLNMFPICFLAGKVD